MSCVRTSVEQICGRSLHHATATRRVDIDHPDTEVCRANRTGYRICHETSNQKDIEAEPVQRIQTRGPR